MWSSVSVVKVVLGSASVDIRVAAGDSGVLVIRVVAIGIIVKRDLIKSQKRPNTEPKEPYYQ